MKKRNLEKTKEKRFEKEENKCIYYMADLNKELMKACVVGNLKGAEAAIENGADVNIKNDFGKTPLAITSDITSDKGNIELAKMLISRGADVNSKDRWGVSPLDITSHKGNIELAKLLIENGADVNIKNIFELSPLHIASMDGKIEMVNLLLSKGARFDKKTIDDAKNTKIKSILEKWPLTMTLATLQSDPMVYNVYNHTDAKEGDMINLKDYLGKKGIDYGGKRRIMLKLLISL
jgi:ankyrin repeat protein